MYTSNPRDYDPAAAVETSRRDPYSWYAAMRRTSPVFYDPNDGCWHVFRYDDVQRVLQEYATFSSDLSGQLPIEQRDAIQASIIAMDPPRHHRLRALVSKAFTPKAVAGLAPRIAAITNELLDRVGEAGQMDVIADLAYPLPVTVIAEMLGVPVEDRAQFKEWSDAIVGETGGLGGGERELAEYFFHAIEQRRRDPRNDLITALLRAEVDDQRLSIAELLGFCVLLLVAGNETTTNLIGNAVLCFAENPDALRRIRANPLLLPSAIEEVLRYRSPVQALPNRITTRDTDLGGQQIKRGQHVVFWIGSANRDEEKFPDADSFLIDRTANQHLAFGAG